MIRQKKYFVKIFSGEHYGSSDRNYKLRQVGEWSSSNYRSGLRIFWLLAGLLAKLLLKYNSMKNIDIWGNRKGISLPSREMVKRLKDTKRWEILFKYSLSSERITLLDTLFRWTPGIGHSIVHCGHSNVHSLCLSVLSSTGLDVHPAHWTLSVGGQPAVILTNQKTVLKNYWPIRRQY